jgi:hypothetical protein
MEAQRVQTLLQEASLLSLTLRGGQAEILFDALRRNVDGSDLDDRRIKLELRNVRGVAVAYDRTSIEERPSQFVLPPEVAISTLGDLPFPIDTPGITLDSRASEEDLRFAPRVDWLERETSRLDASPHQISIHFELGLPCIPVQLFLGYADLQIYDPAQPLALELWEEQFHAWWDGWSGHWSSTAESTEAPASSPVLEDSFIPVGSDEPEADHEPPDLAPFELRGGLEIPAEILEPLREWFEGTHARDWSRVVAALRQLDRSPEDQADSLASDVYTWPYAREIDAWWSEIHCAHVRILGVEHYPPIEELPAESHEVVWNFALRLRDSKWCIRTYTEQWAETRHGRTVAHAPRAWLAEFDLEP